MTMTKENGYGWTITEDRVEEGRRVGTVGPSDCPFDAEEIKEKGQYFRMYDDDGEYMYGGYRVMTGEFDGDEEAEFSPLDNFGGPNAGATELRYRNPKTGKMEIL